MTDELYPTQIIARALSLNFLTSRQSIDQSARVYSCRLPSEVPFHVEIINN